MYGKVLAIYFLMCGRYNKVSVLLPDVNVRMQIRTSIITVYITLHFIQLKNSKQQGFGLKDFYRYFLFLSKVSVTIYNTGKKIKGIRMSIKTKLVTSSHNRSHRQANKNNVRSWKFVLKLSLKSQVFVFELCNCYSSCYEVTSIQGKYMIMSHLAPVNFFV